MKYTTYIFLFILSGVSSAWAQGTPIKEIVVADTPQVVVTHTPDIFKPDSLDTDTVLLLEMKEYTYVSFKNKREWKQYWNLVDIVKKVYPIAKQAGIRMDEYAAAADTLKKGQVKDLVALIEEEIKTDYEEDLKKLTFKQGMILLKLLDRQTAKTPYAIVKELKNGFSAFIWQGVASIFNYDLKQGFDPENVQEDQWIDEICHLIDDGKL